MAQGKCLLQPHHLIDGLENVIGEDKGKKILSDGPFSEVLRSAQVFFFHFFVCFSFESAHTLFL